MMSRVIRLSFLLLSIVIKRALWCLNRYGNVMLLAFMVLAFGASIGMVVSAWVFSDVLASADVADICADVAKARHDK